MPEVTLQVYLESKKSLADRIKAYNDLITAMENRAAEVAAGLNASVDEYSMDDGQMKVRTKYRNIDDVIAGILALERMKQIYINRYNGRVFVLRDVKGLN